MELDPSVPCFLQLAVVFAAMSAIRPCSILAGDSYSVPLEF
jgi:hypothetical protein